MVLAYAAAWGIGRLSFWKEGGLLPRQIREETALDFVESAPEMMERLLPECSLAERKRIIEGLLEEMTVAAARLVPGTSLDYTLPQHFVPAAVRVAGEQESDRRVEIGVNLVVFLFTHRLWFRGALTMPMAHALMEQGGAKFSDP